MLCAGNMIWRLDPLAIGYDYMQMTDVTSDVGRDKNVGKWWAVLGSNQWLPPCEGGTLPLS